MMFSVVVSTRRDIEALEPLFITSTPDAEMIIIDTNYNDKTKEDLKNMNHNYYKVTYAPPRELEKYMLKSKCYVRYKRDLVVCNNTAFAYSEQPWIVLVGGDCQEFKPDFFDLLKKDIESFTKNPNIDKFIFRGVKLEEWSQHKKWEGLPHLKDVKRYQFLDGSPPFVTLDISAFPLKAMIELNGEDERYDIGHGYEDNDAFYRFLSLGYTIILDKELMTFQTEHWVQADPLNFSKLLFEFTMLEIANGRYKAYNHFDFKDMHEKMLSEKDKYEVKK